MAVRQKSKLVVTAAILSVSILVSAGQMMAAQEKVAPKEVVDDFSGETVGAEPTSFVPAVGNWIIGADGNNKVLIVDGRKWSEGQPSAGLADKARALYGERAHRSGRRHSFQLKAQWRLSDCSRQCPREQSGPISVCARQAKLRQMDSQHSDRDANVARPQAGGEWNFGKGLSRWKTLSRAHTCLRCFRQGRRLVQSG